MRIVFFVLLLANAVFFAWSWFAQAASGESQLVQQQLHPEAIRLLTPEQVARAAAKPAPAPAKQAAQAPQAGKTADSVAAGKAPQAVKVAACMELGAFNPADVQKIEQALVPLALGEHLSQRRVDETAGYWVFLPPQGNRQGAIRKVAELKKLGVGEFFVVQDDPEFRFAISLGVFKSREAARSRLAELREKGVKTARVGARETVVPKVFFTVREVPEPTAAKLNELRQGYPGAELRECQPEKRVEPAAPA